MSASFTLAAGTPSRQHERHERRLRTTLWILAATSVIAFLIALSYGSYPVSISDIVRSLVGVPASDPKADYVVRDLRLARVLVAWLVGAGLGISGAIVQGLTRNPLAEPGILGVNTGASLAALSVILFVPSVSPSLLPLVAFAGAMLTAGLLYVSTPRGGLSSPRLVLIGIALFSILSTILNVITVYGRQVLWNWNFDSMKWLQGSLAASWPELGRLSVCLAVLVPLALLSARDLNALAMGEEVAVSVGSRVERHRIVLMLIAAAIASVCVATAGPIAFVGLLAPNAARRLVGTWQPRVLPVSAMLGAVLLTFSDLAGRALFAPKEISATLIVAMIGTPFLVYLLVRTQRQRMRA
jgi:iron complex transport system permease protein